MSEAKFQSAMVSDLLIEGRTVLKLDPGTGNIPKGWPDLCILGPGGSTLWCEVKDWDGEVKKGQRRTLLLLHLSGHDVCFCDPRPEFCVPVPMSREEIETYAPPVTR